MPRARVGVCGSACHVPSPAPRGRRGGEVPGPTSSEGGVREEAGSARSRVSLTLAALAARGGPVRAAT
jgi:hypothetical protein